MEHKANFWTTLPGILTGLAALITALTGLYLALQQNGGAKPPTPTQTVEPSPAVQAAAVVGLPAGSDAASPTEHAPQPPEIPSNDRTTSETALTPLVDCALPVFQLPNTIKSLMSWSDHYQRQIAAAEGKSARALDACRKAASYRGSAHCQQPSDGALRQALFETLSLCRASGVGLEQLVTR